MKKTKILALILTLMLSLTTLAGCGDKQDNGNDSEKNSTQNQEEANTSAWDGEKIINDDGQEFTINTEASGVLEKGVSVDSKEFVLAGKTYTLPLKVSTLFDDGWTITNNFKDEFKANSVTYLSSFYMRKDGCEISLGQVYNDTDTVQKLEDCQLISLRIYNSVSFEKTDYVFPGGVTAESTALDILTKYGNPNDNSKFANGTSSKNGLTYVNQKTSGYRFFYAFNDDGTLYSANIEIEQTHLK